MRRILFGLVCIPLLLASVATAQAPVHVWEKQEVTLTASQKYANAYTDVTVWVDLTGPNFKKRVYGFWDGDQTFKVRVLATSAGKWTWTSGSEPADSGLGGKTASFTAIPWTEAEKEQNTVRRGFLQATPNHHALEQADGTPFFILGDTWWTTGTNVFRWYDDDNERPIGPAAGFKDYVRYRKAQGFNLVTIIAGFPSWASDGKPAVIVMNDPERTVIRGAWPVGGAASPEGKPKDWLETDSRAKNMDNEGGRPFFFPGKVPGFETVYPDVDRINPKYFDYLDRKIDYLNSQGFIPFIEVMRRDSSEPWRRYYKWPDSYARYIQYIYSRYQANNVILSPIHFDTQSQSIPPADYMQAIQLVMTKYGPPPFGTLLSANASPSTLVNWGPNSWVTLHQTGNLRTHDYYWYLTQIYNSNSTQPAMNGEPPYAGFIWNKREGYLEGSADPGTEKDDRFVRSGMYGSFLSGGLAGHVYGAENIERAEIEPEVTPKMWDAFQYTSAAQMKYLKEFAFSIGPAYQDLVPESDLITPSRSEVKEGYDGWAYLAHTPDMNIVMAYFEKGSKAKLIRGLRPSSTYRAQWFDPRTGTWSDAGTGWLQSNSIAESRIPPFPSDTDYGLRLIYAGPEIPAPSATAKSTAP